MKKSDCIAIIPARGGSKRIPKKNIKSFLGKPIISYAIEAARESGLFDEIMVSTDSMEIAEIAKMYGASVPFMRDCTMAGDYVSIDDVLLNVLQKYRNKGKIFQYMACIYPTAPFVTPIALQEAFKLLKENSEASMVMPIAAFTYPPQRCYVIDKKGMATFKNLEYMHTRSQDLEVLYHEVGQYYIYDSKKFIEARGRIYDNIIPLLVDEIAVQDIDNESDWKIAELKYMTLNSMR